ncbi:hypothetical protein EXN66_Car021749 [Channa argus]|uniref:Uncharacterized protein n=1 Tax=Channa argus TaxID=215402 RepID=A0A6G1QV13_CHAAH|nr:hypothetical protein EXN66_Car021749 [Channa argus]
MSSSPLVVRICPFSVQWQEMDVINTSIHSLMVHPPQCHLLYSHISSGGLCTRDPPG